MSTRKVKAKAAPVDSEGNDLPDGVAAINKVNDTEVIVILDDEAGTTFRCHPDNIEASLSATFEQ